MRGRCRGWELLLGQPQSFPDGLGVPSVFSGEDEDSGPIKSEGEGVDLFDQVMADCLTAQGSEVPVELHAEGAGVGLAWHREVEGASVEGSQDENFILWPVGLMALTSGHGIGIPRG